MALEVSEIGIRVQVSSDEAPQADESSADGETDVSDEARAAIVNECVRRVLHALRTSQER